MGINGEKAEKSRESYPQGQGVVFQSFPQPLKWEMQVVLQEFSTGKVILGILWKPGVECVEKLGRKNGGNPLV